MRCKRCNRISFASVFSASPYCKNCSAIVAREEHHEQQLNRLCYDEMCKSLLSGTFNSRFVIDKLEHFRSLGLRNAHPIKLSVYSFAVTKVSEDKRITDEERKKLQRIREILKLGDDDVGKIDRQLQRMETTWQLQRGELPILAHVGIPLQKNEVAHVRFEGVEYHQDRVVKRGYVGGSSGFSVRICKGVTYRVGAHRGELVKTTALVHLDTGELLLTSKRLIFSGFEKAFSVPGKKVLSATPYADGISIVKDSTAQSNKPHVFRYHDAEMLNLAVACWLNAV